MAIATHQRVLSDDLLARCGERAPIYDRENRFFDEDFAELRHAGYLRKYSTPSPIWRSSSRPLAHISTRLRKTGQKGLITA